METKKRNFYQLIKVHIKITKTIEKESNNNNNYY